MDNKDADGSGMFVVLVRNDDARSLYVASLVGVHQEKRSSMSRLSSRVRRQLQRSVFKKPSGLDDKTPRKSSLILLNERGFTRPS